MCEMSQMALTGPGDACSLAVAGLFTNDLTNIAYLYAGDCPTRFQAFGTGCASVIGNEVSYTIFVTNCKYGIYTCSKLHVSIMPL